MNDSTIGPLSPWSDERHLAASPLQTKLVERAIQRRDEEKVSLALPDSDALLRAIIDALPAAVYTTDAKGCLTHFNQAARNLSGREPQLGTDKWCVTWKLFLPDGTPLPHAECPMAIAVKEDRIVHGVEAVAERPDGTQVSAIANATPLHDSQGRVIGGINILVDITEQKEAKSREVLLSRELEHRTQNLFAVIQSIATRSLSGDRTLDEARKVFSERLFALARANDIVSATSWLGAPLAEVLDRGMASFSGRFSTEGELFVLNRHATQGFALIIHELCTNASKYGAFSEPGGRVEVSWLIIADADHPRFVFRWQEHEGPPVSRPASTGFGSTLLQRSIGGLDQPATIDYASGGLIYTLNAPLAAVGEAPSGFSGTRSVPLPP